RHARRGQRHRGHGGTRTAHFRAARGRPGRVPAGAPSPAAERLKAAGSAVLWHIALPAHIALPTRRIALPAREAARRAAPCRADQSSSSTNASALWLFIGITS